MEPEPILSESDEDPEAAPAQAAINPEAWQRVQLARHPKRPHTLDYIERLFTDFEEIHGDRLYGDDAAIVCGAAFTPASTQKREGKRRRSPETCGRCRGWRVR